MQSMDLRGLNPAPVTAFNRDGSLDIEANVRIAKWLASFDEVKSLVILGHAGEGTFLTTEERLELIAAYRDAVDIPIIAGITGEGTKVAAEEAKRSYDAGATGALVYPNHGWLRFGFQKGAPQDRYKAIYQEGGLQTILFQYPAATKANYDLETQLDIAAQEGCVATNPCSKVELPKDNAKVTIIKPEQLKKPEKSQQPQQPQQPVAEESGEAPPRPTALRQRIRPGESAQYPDGWLLVELVLQEDRG